VAADVKVDAVLMKERLQPEPLLDARRAVRPSGKGYPVPLLPIQNVALHGAGARAVERLVPVDDDPVCACVGGGEGGGGLGWVRSEDDGK
jgi:hypothetical protein